jgi:Zn-dependent metalloprotease
MCNHHRHSIFCIMPPHILRNIARNGTHAQRDFALRTLASDGTIRTTRLTFSLIGGLKVPHPAATLAPPREKRSIYNAANGTDLPGKLLRGEGDPPASDTAVNDAYDALGDTFNFYIKAFDRNSIDNAGMALNASIHYGTDYDNAFWNGQQMVFGDGDQVIFSGFTTATDVIGHELTHGVTGSEANLTYQGISGALNESISDVFGSMVKQYKLNQTAEQADWLIGAGILAKGISGVALRSLKAPGTAYNDATLGKDPQPAAMSDYLNTDEDNGGVHINSGIPNHAFYLAATAIGGNSWEKAGQIWYDALVDHNLKPNATFATFANLTINHAGSRYGAQSTEQKAMADAWAKVGVKTQGGKAASA